MISLCESKYVQRIKLFLQTLFLRIVCKSYLQHKDDGKRNMSNQMISLPKAMRGW